MVKFINNLGLAGAVGVEHSDERLAAVEEAKRTGGEFQSVGAKGHDIVDPDTLRVEVERVSNEGSSDPNIAPPDYLIELMQGVDDTIELNQQKAKEHNEYSREIVKAQMQAAIQDEAKLRDDPDYFARRIAENNRRLADNHNTKSAQFAERTFKNAAGVEEEIRSLRPEAATDPNPVTVLGQKSKVTDISESFADNELKQKDRIIYGEQSYRANAEAPRKVAPTDDRGLDTKLTDEPKRVEEPVRNQAVADSKPAQSPVIDGSAAKSETNDSKGNEQKPETAKDSDSEPKRRSSKGNSKE